MYVGCNRAVNLFMLNAVGIAHCTVPVLIASSMRPQTGRWLQDGSVRGFSQELDVFSATFARLARRKEGCRFIVAKVRMQIVIGSEWSSASRDVSKHSDWQRVVKCKP